MFSGTFLRTMMTKCFSCPPSLQLFMPWANGFTSAQQKDVVFPASYFGGSLDDQKVWINKGVGRVRLFLSACCPPADCNTAAVLSATLCLRDILATAAPVVFTASLLHLCLRPEQIDKQPQRAQNLFMVTDLMVMRC